MTTAPKLAILAIAASIAHAALAQTPEPASFLEAIEKGKASLNIRLRYEHVAQDNALADADALTARARLGFKTASYNGLAAYIEAHTTTALVEDYAFPGGGATATSIVADPDSSDLSQAWLSYTSGKTTTTLGRQNLVIDNTRFVGNVAWRQSYQTFDSLVLKDATIDDLTLTYGYLWGVNRIFGDLSTAQPDFHSDSHILNASYKGLPFGTLAAYAYLLDFDNAAPNSTATYGLSLAGSAPVGNDLKLTYRAEYATQSDYGSSALNYRADYYSASIGLAAKTGSIALGYETLGSDNGQGFKTPLATLHAFNGWADLFLVTPGAGLRDLNLKASTKLGEIDLAAAYHRFNPDAGGPDFGSEIDLQAAYKLNKHTTLIAKAAFYQAKALSVDTDKFWLQADLAF